MQIGRLQIGVVGALEIAQPLPQHLAATEQQLGPLFRLLGELRQARKDVGRLFPRRELHIEPHQRFQRLLPRRILRQHQLVVAARRLALAQLDRQLAQLAAQLGDAVDVIERQQIEHRAQMHVGGGVVAA